MSEMKKIYITGLWILCLTSGVSAQTYDIIERRNSWNAGANVTGIMMDSISASYAELYGKNNHGDFRNYYEAKEALSLIHIPEPTRQAETSYAVFCLQKKELLR